MADDHTCEICELAVELSKEFVLHTQTLDALDALWREFPNAWKHNEEDYGQLRALVLKALRDGGRI